MTPPAALTQTLTVERNPYVGRLANRIARSFRRGMTSADLDRWALIEEMLGYAAEAEQRLTTLNDRVAYLESLSATDPLTGLANRRGLEEYLRSALASARRHKEVGVLVFIDLDDFKAVNDELGHEAGDTVLVHVANLLKDSIRGSDFVARLGGDEFVVGLVRTDSKDGQARAEKLRRKLERSSVAYRGTEIALSASFGIENYGPAARARDLLRRADKAMYCSKKARPEAAE